MYLLLVSTSSLLSLATAALLDSPNQRLHYRQIEGEGTYLQSVCLPNTTNPIPPCQQMVNIESACLPNGTLPIDYIAHQECMCGGSFFSNFFGCLNCEYAHGSFSEGLFLYSSELLVMVSAAFCTGTPKTSFAAVLSTVAAEASVPVPGTAGTGTTDLYPSQTAVSLYYTAKGPQGAGPITGSATAATEAVSSVPTSKVSSLETSMTMRPSGSSRVVATGTASASTSASTSTSTTASGSESPSQASQTTSRGAAATKGYPELLRFVAGAAVIAVL